MTLTVAQLATLRRVLSWLSHGHRLLCTVAPDAAETLGMGIAVDELRTLLRSEDDTKDIGAPKPPPAGA